MRICPNPNAWFEAYQSLLRYAEAHPCTPGKPPVLLILAGWAYTNDMEKRLRWEETVAWAINNGCGHIIEALTPNDYYDVNTPSTYMVGPMGGPMYRSWDFERKERPSPEEIENYLTILQENWSDIVGSCLGPVTRPQAFTGRKFRRLLIFADQDVRPPWGGWTYRSETRDKRYTFTQFRLAINQSIKPHEIDHIDFISG